MNDELPLVTGMPHGFVSPDGELAEMEFELSDGSRQRLRFSPTTMSGFCGRVFELVANQRRQTGVASGPYPIQPIQVGATFADAAVGGAAVIVGIRMKSGFPVHFAVDTREAAELHRQLGKAVKKAKRQSSDSRH